MHTSLAIIALLGFGANAYPNMSPPVLKKMAEIVEARGVKAPQLEATRTAKRSISSDEGNCGPVPCLVFSETEQEVSTTGQNAYASPAPDEIRGPCPGLNAAANHGVRFHYLC